MPAFEVEWWRCERDAIKKLIFRAERSSVSVCSKASHLEEAHSESGNSRIAEV